MTSHCCQRGKPVPHSHQLLNHVVDCVATRKPQALFAEYPVSPTSYQDGFMKITYAKLANAINCIAWWLVDNLGPGREYETLAYIGPNDLTYPALILGAVKAGYKTLLLSPRNSIEAQQHLLRVTNCKVFLTPEKCPPPVAAVVESLDDTYRVLKVPTVGELLRPRQRPFVYDVPFEVGRHAPLTVMHTSGSTGLPKPVTWPQDFAPAYAKQLQLEPPPGYESTDKLYEANRIFVVFPPFHAAYVAHVLVNAITNQTAVVFPLKGAVPSAVSLSETVQYTKVDAALVVPAIIEEMSRSPELLDNIATHVDTMVYSGGDVPQGCGDIVAARVPIVNFYGSTEGASLALIHEEGDLSREEWKYLCIHPDAGVEFRYHADDMYELYIIKRPELAEHQQIFRSFPDHDEWRTKDLFRKHPTKPNLWNHCGRADDTIVFLTGEKVNPVNMEQYIFSRHPEVGGVLVAGSQRFQAALLVELVRKEDITEEYKKDLIEQLWPSIEHINQNCPSHARIAKSHIIFTDPRRPMSRSPKGTIQRAATMAEYAGDLDVLYKAADDLDVGEAGTADCDLRDTESAMQCLRTVIATLTGHGLAAEDNFFLQGMDSLQSLLVVREVRRLFAIPQLEISTIYAHPTLASLVEVLQQMKTGQPPQQAPKVVSGVNSIESMLAQYSKLIDRIPRPTTPPSSPQEARVFLLTGSTGFLGSYILEALLQSDAAHVYCLNRSTDSGLLQLRRNASRGLSKEIPETRVTFLTAELSQPSFGLDQRTYQSLQRTVTHIIHNAWSVDFNIPLSAYRPQLQGVVEMAKFATMSSHQPSLFYISSVSAVSSFQGGRIPEQILTEESVVAPMGYGASKYISERLLDYAAKRLSLKTRIARIGQIAGPVAGHGQWNRWEWLPSLIRSSFEIGAIPGSLGAELDRVDWVPVDVLASVLLELVDRSPAASGFHQQLPSSAPRREAVVVNVLNPNATQWQHLLPAIVDSLTTLASRMGKNRVEQISFEDWIQKVRSHLESCARATPGGKGELEAILQANPAAKLLGFYEEARMQSAHAWEMDGARDASTTLNAVGEIRSEWMQKWMRGWLPQA